MPKEKMKYGYATEEQAKRFFEATSTPPNISDLLSANGSGQAGFKAQDLVVDPRLWPTLAKILKLDGHPVSADLDFKKVAEWFNKAVAEICEGNEPPVKALNAGEFRKAVLAATRQRLADGKKELKTVDKDSPARPQTQAKFDDAKAILKRQGWTAKAAKRKAKAIVDPKDQGEDKSKATSEEKPDGNAGKEAKSAGNGKKEAKSATQAGAEDPVQAKSDIEAKSKPKQPAKATTDKDESKSEMFYVNGDSFPVRQELKKLGAKFDGKQKQWWFTDEAGLAKGQKIVDDFHAKKATETGKT